MLCMNTPKKPVLTDEERRAELIRIAEADKQEFDLTPYITKPKELQLDYGSSTGAPDGSDLPSKLGGLKDWVEDYERNRG